MDNIPSAISRSHSMPNESSSHNNSEIKGETADSDIELELGTRRVTTSNTSSPENMSLTDKDLNLTPTQSSSESPNQSPISTPKPLSLNDVFTLEQKHSKHSLSHEPLRSDYSDSDKHIDDLSVLHRFRMALRDVGSCCKDAESFIEKLRQEFVGDWDSSGANSPSRQRPENYKRKNESGEKSEKRGLEEGLVEEDLRTRVQHVLKDTNISHFDIEEIFETIDQDGSGTLEWEEFLSFLSLSPASLRLVITRLQMSLKRDFQKTSVEN
jgi:hypothetical protein